MAGKPQVLSPNTTKSYTFFDILAILCHKIYHLPKARQEAIYRIFSASYVTYSKSVQRRFPFLADNNNRAAVYYYNLTSEQATQLLEALSSAESDTDWAVILAAIKAIDRLLELKLNLEKFLLDKPCSVIPLDPNEQPHASNDYHQFDTLNSATKEYGLLLPRESCRWQRSGERTMDSVGFRPLSVMKNYIWVRPDLEYQIVNLHCDFCLPPDCHLKLVTSPLCSQAPFLLHLYPEENSFEIEYLDVGTRKINALFEKAILISAEEHASIAMFPEMMASPASILHCAKYVRSHWTLDMPKLILLPTCEYDSEQGWINELTALDADGSCIFTYHKQHPFRFEKEKELKEKPYGAEELGESFAHTKKTDEKPTRLEVFDEPIQADNIVYLLHVPGIGRIGFLVCSDVFRDGYLDVLLQELKVTLLLHVVYSQGADLLERMLSTAKRNLCDVVICNTCAAWDNVMIASEERPPVKISGNLLINKYCPYGHKYNSMPSTTVTCEQTECSGCVFIVEVANTYDGPQLPVSQRHK